MNALPASVRVRTALILILLCLATGLVAGPVAAQADRIRSIEIEGNQRIEAETVASYLAVQIGEEVTQEKLDTSLKRLFATGFFADVSLRVEGARLVVSLAENPIINRIAFEGNRNVDDDELFDEVQLRPRVVYTRTRVQSDTDRILEIYRRNGRFSARVEPKIVTLPQNRVDLIFEVDEGPQTKIRRIQFIGNRVFSDGDLLEELQSVEARWWRFLTSDDTYDPDRVAFDRELLRRFYLSRGYADFRVQSSVAELTPDREDFFLTFAIEEGLRYRFGEIDIVTEFEDLDPEVLRPFLAIQSGDIYNALLIEDTITALTDVMGTLQYAFVDIRPLISRDRENRTITITFQVNEGPRVFVEEIRISGNTRTVDDVIRREMQLAEGDAFNTALVNRSEQRINDLGFFEEVTVETLQGSDADQSIIDISVTEQSTGELSIAAGFSSTDGLLADLRIRERNLLGLGKDLSFATTLSSRSQEIDLSYTEPYFLDRNLAAGIDLFFITRDFQDESSFDQQLAGFSLRTGYPIARFLTQRLSYRLESTEIENVSFNASRFIRAQEGRTLTSLIGQTLSYDRRNSRLNPSDGYLISISNQFAGIGGDVRFFRNVISGGVFFGPTETSTLALTGEVGNIFGLDEEVRINDRFFLGGDSFRGFEIGGLGPRDLETDDSLGGTSFAKVSAELTYPLGLPSEFGIKAHTFVDAGTVFGAEDEGEFVVDNRSIRMSGGVGVSWRSPFGPIRVDIAKPFIKESFDREEIFRFSFGTQF